MNTKSIALRYLAVSCLGLLTACSGGDINFAVSGPDIRPFVLPWTDEPITAHGVNSDQGQVTVNGIGYWTNQATVTVNGQPGLVSDLRRGQVIIVRGQVYGGSYSGRADSIEYDARLIGPVESLDAPGNRIVVMGQTVISDSDTVFAAGIDPWSYEGLSIGSDVEISGFARAGGTILATRIDTAANSSELQLTGEVANLDLSNLSFEVNDLIVDYSTALVIDLPGGAPGNGMTVRMIGGLSSGHFVVERLAGAPTLTGITGRRVQAAGLVTRFYSAGDFYVNHFAIATNSATAFLFGDREDLALNVELVIDGYAASNGRVTADRVTFGL